MSNTTTNDIQSTWQTYVKSWKTPDAATKRALFERSLSESCVYRDPQAQAEGWEQILDYMMTFHQQIPGAYFHTTKFWAHHGRSLAQWEMRDGNDAVMGTGCSYGEYNDQGRLVSMNGFFDVAPSSEP